MSYTPPAAHSVEFDWDGSLYTPLPGDATFDWTRGSAQGWNAGPTFGAPQINFTVHPSGWQSTYFGNPGNTPLFAAPFTWVATVFGAAGVRHNAIGFQTGAQGTPFGLQANPAGTLTMDLASGAPILPGAAEVVTSPYATAFAAYAAWVTSLGLTADSTLPGMPAIPGTGEEFALIDLGFLVLGNATTPTVLVDTEGNVGLYREYPVRDDSAGRVAAAGAPGQTEVSIIGTYSPPSIIFNCCPTGYPDRKLLDARWQSTGSVAAMYLQWGNAATSLEPSEMALLFSAERVEVVGYAPGGSLNRLLQLLCTNSLLPYDAFDSDGYAPYGGGGLSTTGGFTESIPPNGLSHYLLQGTVPVHGLANDAAPPTRFGEPILTGAVTEVKDLTTGARALGQLHFYGDIGRPTALETYAAWAADLGVSPTTSLAGAPGAAGTATLIDLEFAPLVGGAETRIVFGSQGLAFYRAAIADTTMIDLGVLGLPAPEAQNIMSRWYGTESSPTFILTASPDFSIMRAVGAKWQKLGDIAILYAEWTPDTPTVESVELALRIIPGMIEGVVRNTGRDGGVGDPGGSLQVMCYPQEATSAGYRADAGTSIATTGGATVHPVPEDDLATFPLQFITTADRTVTATGATPSTTFGTTSVPVPRTILATGQQFLQTFGTFTARYAWGPPCVPDGIAPTVAFGTPRRSTLGVATGIAPTTAWGLPQRLLIARGFRSGGMGRPVATWTGIPNFPQTVRAVAFDLTRFGLPLVPGVNVTGRATSLHATAFGLPRVDGVGEHLTVTALAFEVTQIGTHRALRQTEHGAVFIAPGSFGTPTTKSYATATGAQTGQFGAARASRRQTQAGVALTAFGVSKARISQTVAAWTPSTTFGAGKTLGTTHAPGFKATLFGTTLAAAGQRAAGFAAARWGTPSIYRPNTYLAQGLNAGPRFGQPYTAPLQRATGLYAPARFGVPVAERERLGQRASGFVVGNFGTPGTHWRVHARHIAPSTTFGAPTISRSILC